MRRWRDVRAYPGYMVSDDGQVWGPRKLLKGVLNPDGYPVVRLYKDRKGRFFKVHQLVLLAFNGLRPSGMEARHLNGVKTDNRVENLRWGTRQENMADRERHGVVSHGRERSMQCAHLRKLCEEDVLAIRDSTESTYVLGRRFGVSPVAIGHIKRRRTWKWVGV